MATISLLPGVVDLELYAGDGATLRVVATDSEGQPFPLDGVTVAQVKVKREDSEVVATFSVDDADAANGVLVLSLTGADTESMLANVTKFAGVWDVQWTGAGVQPKTLVQGKVTCVSDVTRA